MIKLMNKSTRERATTMKSTMFQVSEKNSHPARGVGQGEGEG